VKQANEAQIEHLSEYFDAIFLNVYLGGAAWRQLCLCKELTLRHGEVLGSSVGSE
jgi:hypothetical protein